MAHTVRTNFVDEDRFDRMKRIEWIDIEKIHRSRCLVVGAGALGNEAVKNLVLAGFRDITLIDNDDIVLSNLSRCLFFREKDIRTVKKSEIVAERAMELDPGCDIKAIVSDVQDLNDWNYDIILGCLDNIKTRLHVNAFAYFNKIPYIDGATDGMIGKVQTVLPDGPCYECFLNRSHVESQEEHFTCTGNGHAFVPKIASEITTTAIIAGIQVREAIKVASGREDLCIRNISYYNGEMGTLETYEIPINPECPNHMK